MNKLKLYTSPEKVKEEGLYIIRSNDAYFDLYTKKLMMDEYTRDMLKKYDGIETTVGEIPVAVKTKYSGTGYVEYTQAVSTGVKALLNVYFLTNKGTCVSVTECGSNILFDIFKLAASKDIPLLLEHCDLPGFKDFDIIVNNEREVDNNFELYQYCRNFLYGGVGNENKK